jgi:UDP-3-O-[3-hydroxymyristoyl] N-acetylglucosamine deacetylase
VSYLNQKTILEPINFSGIGLHSGLEVNLTLKPAEPNSGILFKRIDLKENNILIPSFLNVTNTSLNTTISNEFGVKIATIEHLMGALLGLGIDNVIVEINNEEVPILDGSAKLFVEKIISSGLKTSQTPIKIIKILNKVEYSDGFKYASIEPSILNLVIDFELKYNNKFIGNQRNKIKVFEDNLMDIFNSRTFCLFEDIENIKKMGLAKGGSIDNAIVVEENKILNSGGLRNENEFVNHKILDCMGDLYTSGFRILGNVFCSQGGHYLTNQLLRKVFKDRSNYSLIEIKEKNLPHTLIKKTFLKSIA